MTTLFFLLKMYFLFVWMFCLHVCAWYLQVRRYRALWNWSLWSEVCGALASVQVPIEVRGVRFPLGLKLQRAVSCLVGVLGIEVRFSWRCIFLRLYFFKYLCVFVGVWGQPSGVIFFFLFCSGEWTQVVSRRCFTCWATQGLVFKWNC